MSKNPSEDVAAGPLTLTGKVGVVCGASSGIGRATAKLLARRGAMVIVSSRDQRRCDELVEEIRQDGGRGAAFAADVTDYAQTDALAQFIRQDFGRLDLAFNNAGKILGFGLLHEAEPEGFIDAMTLNAGGVFHGLRFQIPLMIESGGGAIVVNSALSGLRGMPTIGLYSAAKSAAITLALVAAQEAGPKNVRVNVVAPGYIATDAWTAKLGPQAEALAAGVPLRRIGAPDDVAGTVAWLLSDEARYLSGVVVPVDGGMYRGPGSG